MHNDYIKELIDKLMRGDISLEELDELISIGDNPIYSNDLSHIIDEAMASHTEVDIDPLVYEQLQQKIDSYVVDIPKRSYKRVRFEKIWKWSAAACLAIMLSIYFYGKYGLQDGYMHIGQFAQIDVETEETYTSFGGSTIIGLEDIQVGEQIVSNGLVIKKVSDNELVYENDFDATDDVELTVVSIATSAKDTYRVTLPDGTKAWLNAQSSLSFPSRFTEKQRKVYMNGELYFEVTPAAAAANKPFVVEASDQTITVLGTAFNIEAYKKKNKVTTSLIEGKIALSSKGSNVVLSAGQQSVLAANSSDFVIGFFDAEEVLAWREGYFVFNEVPLPRVLEDLSKWYGFEMNELTKEHMKANVTAKINRNIPLTSVLKSMEKFTPYVFTVEKNRLIIKDK